VQERNRRLHKTDWLNTPNVYKKEEIDEIGTDNPKKITKVGSTTPIYFDKLAHNEKFFNLFNYLILA